MAGRSQNFAIARENAEVLTRDEFIELCKTLDRPSDKELKRMIAKQEKIDRRAHKSHNPGKYRRAYRRMAKKLRGKPKLSFRGIKRNGSTDKWLDAIYRRVQHH